MTNTFTLHGSHGEIVVDAASGAIVSRSDAAAYSDVARIDVEEWRAAYPGEKPEGGAHDVLDFGFWYRDGEYEPPLADWRAEFRNARGVILDEAAALLIRSQREGAAS